MLKLPEYLIGVGDRLGRQRKALLSSVIAAYTRGLDIASVCNLPPRAHSLIVTRPADVERETDAAVQALDWQSN